MTKNYIDLNIDFYNKTQINNLMANKADSGHNHDSTYAKISDLTSMTGARLEIIKIDDTVQNLTSTYGTIAAGLTAYCQNNNIALQTNYIYLVQNNDSSDQYIYSNNTFIYQGKNDINLSDYVQKTDPRLTNAREPLPHTHEDLENNIELRTTKAQVLSILKEYGIIKSMNTLNSVQCVSDRGYDLQHPIKIQNGESAVLTATVRKDGDAVPNIVVSFYEDDTYLGESKSDINGEATFIYQPTKPGIKIISASASDILDSIDASIVVTDQPTTIEDFNVPSGIQKNTTYEFSVLCLDEDNNPIPGAQVKLYETYTPTEIKLNFSQDNLQNAENPLNPQQNEKIDIQATVKDVDGSLIAGYTIDFWYEVIE